jgi:hypothetical protein
MKMQTKIFYDNDSDDEDGIKFEKEINNFMFDHKVHYVQYIQGNDSYWPTVMIVYDN